MRHDSYKKALAYAYRLLNIRQRSVKEIYQRLREKGYSKEISDEVADNLKSQGYLDDLKFASEWIENRLRLSPKGAVAIRHELKEKGIPDSVADEALENIEGQFDEYDIAKEFVQQKSASFKNLPQLKRRKKIYDILCRRGFNFDIIERILHDVG